jgi:hypothetical protein
VWALKREAAAVLALACDAYGDEYATLRSRIVKALCRASAADRTLPSRYGGIVGLTALGPRAVSAFLLDPSTVWFKDFEATLDADGAAPPPAAAAEGAGNDRFKLSDSDRYGVQMCQRAMLDAVGMVLRYSVSGRRLRVGGADNNIVLGDVETLLSEMRSLQQVLGDKWVAFGCCDEEYAQCFV